MENFHIITVKYSGATDTRGSRIVMHSARFKQTKSISYNHECNSTQTGAIDWLCKNGFNIIGKAEGPATHDYIITDTFKGFKND